MKSSSGRLVLLLPLLAAALLTCTDNGGSIYWTLENETKISKPTLSENLTVAGVAAMAAGGPYYVAAGRIWKKADENAKWNLDAPLAPPVTGALCYAIAAFQGDLYGGFFTPSASLGLYKTTATDTFANATAVGGAIAGKQIVGLYVVNDGAEKLVAVTAEAGSRDLLVYNAYISADGATFTDLLIRPNTSPAYEAETIITGVAYVDTSFWVTAGTKLYAGAAAPLSTTPVSLGSFTIASTDRLKGLFGDPTNNRLFAASLNGVIYIREAGDAWSKVPSSGSLKESDTVVPLLCVAGPVDAGQTRYLVGSEGYGYYTLAMVATPTLTRFDTITVNLYTDTVRNILVDPGTGSGTLVFAGTAGNGLWRAFFTSAGIPSSDTARSWNPE